MEEVKEVRSAEGGLGDQLSHIQAELQAVTAERNQLEEKLQERSNLENQLREEEMLNKRLGELFCGCKLWIGGAVFIRRSTI